MFLRETSGQTLTEVRDALPNMAETISLLNSQIQVTLTEDTPEIRLRPQADGQGIAVPADRTALDALATWLNIPSAFFFRQQPDVQEYLVRTLLERNPAGVHAVVEGENLLAFRNPNEKLINPKRLVEAGMRVLGEDAPVIEWWHSNDDLRVDVVVPDDAARGIGGDPAVNDITKAGVRFGQQTGGANLAPWVQPFQYRLVCTNGQETRDDGFKIEMRGNTVEQVLAEFEAQADRAFKRAEQEIVAFYDLRNVVVDNPERTLIRMAQERSIPDRTITALVRRVPAEIEGDTATMFDIVNLITNLANDPEIRTKSGPRRTLEQFGGSVVTEHAERCGHCQAKLN